MVLDGTCWISRGTTPTKSAPGPRAAAIPAPVLKNRDTCGATAGVAWHALAHRNARAPHLLCLPMLFFSFALPVARGWHHAGLAVPHTLFPSGVAVWTRLY